MLQHGCYNTAVTTRPLPAPEAGHPSRLAAPPPPCRARAAPADSPSSRAETAPASATGVTQGVTTRMLEHGYYNTDMTTRMLEH
eukprot:456993-Prorocentrum_minimum.AAC.1